LVGGFYGFMFGGPVGALMGMAVGGILEHSAAGAGSGRASYSKPYKDPARNPFFTTTFQVMGWLSTLDERVIRADDAGVRTAMDYMRLTPEQRQRAACLFEQGAMSAQAPNEILDDFRDSYRGEPRLMSMLVEIQLAVACANGMLSDEVRAGLLHACRRLRFPRDRFESLAAAAQAHVGSAGAHQDRNAAPQASLENAYRILSLRPMASNEEVKRAYRRLINRHHPDKLSGQGLSEHAIRHATTQTREITVAYLCIRNARGFKA
jgi:DnaJ like chaperone protein